MTVPTTAGRLPGRLPLQLAAPLAALAILMGFNLAVGGAGWEDLRIVLLQSSKVVLVATGMTLVIATGGVDLSVGSVMAVSGSLAAVLAASGRPVGAAVAAGLAAGAAIGGANGVLVSVAGVQPIVATLIFMVFGRGAAMLVTGSQPVPIDADGLLAFGDRAPVIALLAFVATALVLGRTALGWFVSAVGDNETASRLCGLRSGRIKVLVYVFSGVCAAVAGLVAAARVETADASRLGELLELDAIFAVVVGGTALTGGRFSLVGSLVGALLIQTLTFTMIRQGMPPEITPVPKAIVIVSVCLLQSESFRRRVFRRAGRPRTPAADPAK